MTHASSRRKQEDKLLETTDKLAASIAELAVTEESDLDLKEKIRVLSVLTTWLAAKNRIEPPQDDEETELVRYKQAIEAGNRKRTAGAEPRAEQDGPSEGDGLAEIRSLLKRSSAAKGVSGDSVDIGGEAAAPVGADGSGDSGDDDDREPDDA